MLSRNKRRALTWMVVLFISFIVLTMAAYINFIYRIEEVYVANRFIPEGTRLTADKFSRYVGVMPVPYDIAKSLKLLTVNSANQSRIMNGYIKYNRGRGDFITEETIKIKNSDPLKYLMFELSKKAANGKLLVPIMIEIPANDRFLTSGVQVYDRVGICFLKITTEDSKKMVKLVTRYRNVPIIQLQREADSDFVKTIVLAIPSELNHKYEIEARESQGIRIIFNPLNYQQLVDSKVHIVTSHQIDDEYRSGKVYDLKDEINVEQL